MRILIVVGTRPEAIKMMPLYLELERHGDLDVRLCDSGQQRDMTSQMTGYFGRAAHHTLDTMMSGQSLASLSARLLDAFDTLFGEESFDLVLVHGDTSTALCASLAAFYHGMAIGHVEAGLRTHDVHSPFPEEFNRVAIDALADIHFAPTPDAAAVLLAEGRKNIFTVGNTVIDALSYTLCEEFSHPLISEAAGRRIVLITAHRRENRRSGLDKVLRAVGEVLRARRDVFGIFPVHPSPEVREAAISISEIENIRLCEPLPIFDFHNLMRRSYAIISDSGGIQEEAAYLGIPTLVLREETERAEALERGCVKLIGTHPVDIERELSALLDLRALHESMSVSSDVFGRGGASVEIAKILLSFERKNDIIIDSKF